jgi:hypothetical protein
MAHRKVGLLFNSTQPSSQPPVPQEENGSCWPHTSRREPANQPTTCCYCGTSGTVLKSLCALWGESGQRAVNGERTADNRKRSLAVDRVGASGLVPRGLCLGLSLIYADLSS